MSAIQTSVQEVSSLYTSINCDIATSFLVYDWLLCFGREVSFIWNWHSGLTASSVLYGLSRYTALINIFLGMATIYPMSDASCAANVWAQIATQILGTTAFSAFSVLRAYALSNRNKWLAFLIILLALPPSVITIIEAIYLDPSNLPSPYNCSNSNSLSPVFSTSVIILFRSSQLAAELLVIGITWWYTCQSYRIWKGLKLGKTVSSLLFYNGSLYFLFLATLYIVDIILSTSSAASVLNADGLLDLFYDPITSLLVCRFMLSLREFDATNASMSISVPASRVRERMASTVLEFGAQSSQSLPAFIAPFAHPIHVASVLTDMDDEATIDGLQELGLRGMGLGAGAAIPETPSSAQSPEPGQPSNSRAAYSA